MKNKHTRESENGGVKRFPRVRCSNFHLFAFLHHQKNPIWPECHQNLQEESSSISHDSHHLSRECYLATTHWTFFLCDFVSYIMRGKFSLEKLSLTFATLVENKDNAIIHFEEDEETFPWRHETCKYFCLLKNERSQKNVHVPYHHQSQLRDTEIPLRLWLRMQTKNLSHFISQIEWNFVNGWVMIFYLEEKVFPISCRRENLFDLWP